MRTAGVSRRDALAALAVLSWSGPAAAADGAASPVRAALLARAEAALMHADPIAALDDFERAAMMVHAPDAELGSIRAAMQSGQYRRALAFCAHTAGEHLEAAEAGALYAWLLRVGGQRALADRVLDETLARSPGAAVPTAVREAFRADLPVARGVLLAAPQRMAPWPTLAAGQAPLPRRTQAARGGGVLVGDGSRALVSRAALPAAPESRLWVRNGLGETTEATVRGGDPEPLSSADLAVVDLRTPLATGGTSEAPEPFAGSPGHSLRFAPGGDAAWPWLAQGFFGAAEPTSGWRKLDFGGADALGATVLDRSGRLAGIVVAATADGLSLWLPAARWAPALGTAAGDVRPGAGSLTAPDVVYEAGLRRALQVVVEG